MEYAAPDVAHLHGISRHAVDHGCVLNPRLYSAAIKKDNGFPILT
jgi:hypothetical protein